MRLCPFVFWPHHFPCWNHLEPANLRIVPTDDAYDAYEEEVQRIAACREGTVQESVVYLESPVVKWVACRAVAASRWLGSLFVVAFVRQCCVDNEATSLLDWVRTSQRMDGAHVEGRTRADRAALLSRPGVVVVVVAAAAAGPAEKRSPMQR